MQKEMLLLKMKRTESEASYAALGFKPASLQFSVELKKKKKTTNNSNKKPTTWHIPGLWYFHQRHADKYIEFLYQPFGLETCSLKGKNGLSF